MHTTVVCLVILIFLHARFSYIHTHYIFCMYGFSTLIVRCYNILYLFIQPVSSLYYYSSSIPSHGQHYCLCLLIFHAESTYPPDLRSSKMVRNERLVGYALYFFNYSTWEGRVLYLEDLFVRQQYRSETIIIVVCLTFNDYQILVLEQLS